MMELYRASRVEQAVDLLVGPRLAILGVAFPGVFAVGLAPKAGEWFELLREGRSEVWFATAPVALVTVPFLSWYVFICGRIVMRHWLDAFSREPRTCEGCVTHASSTPWSFTVGRTFLSGVANHLSVEGHLFTNLPKRVITGLRLGERVRVLHTPRVDYVVALERL